nr:hypothetical protein Iba_chr07bCG5310 [Ipomoea batatas]GMD16002.1 hypothetical protein Iba_chr07cCG5180 [Ipomoea batatas]GMD20415.1 hypothetical protein Iba_chr07fCG4640 [Ipomoea batatas]
MKYASSVSWEETAPSRKKMMKWNVLFPWTSRLQRRKRKKLKCFWKTIFKDANLVMVKQKGSLILQKKWKTQLLLT